MSTHAYSWGWQQPVDSTDKFVLMAMCEYADATGVCWPSLPTLARMTGYHRATVWRCIESLIAAGLVMKSSGRGKSSTYRLMLTAPRLPAEGRRSAVWDEREPAMNERAFPQQLSTPVAERDHYPLQSATGGLSTPVAERDGYPSRSYATTTDSEGLQSATRVVASDATRVVASDATRTVMNRDEPPARAHEDVDPDAWRRIPEANRRLASERLAAIRADLERRASLVAIEDAPAIDEAPPHGIPRPMYLVPTTTAQEGA